MDSISRDPDEVSDASADSSPLSSSEASGSGSSQRSEKPALMPAFLLPAAPIGAEAEYEKVTCLGEGAYGAVWFARRKSDNLKVALKEISRIRFSSDDDVRRMWDERAVLLAIKEAQATNATGVAALTGAFASFATASSVCLVMDLVEGAPLSEHVRLAPLPEIRAQWYAAEVASGLGWLHGAGWLYRDLKLSNVVISATGRARLVDFGFAKCAGRASSVVGTLHTMAPEVVLCADEIGAQESAPGVGYGPSADWWSLGVLVYEMLTAEAPFGYHDDIHLEGVAVLAKQSSVAEVGLVWPESLPIGVSARSFAAALLVSDVSFRLGTQAGVRELQSHPFFVPLDWPAITSSDTWGPAFEALIDKAEATRRPRRGPMALHVQVPEPDPFSGF